MPAFGRYQFYYYIFAIYEPALCCVGFLGALAYVFALDLLFQIPILHSDPKGTHDGQAPDPPTDVPLPTATLVV